MNGQFLLILKILFLNLLIVNVRSYINKKNCRCKYNASSARIIDGGKAVSDELNFVVNIYKRKKLLYPLGTCASKYRFYSICTGSLVSYDWVLTSSFCAMLMQDVDYNYVTFHVATGYYHDLLHSTFNDDYHRQVVENYTMSNDDYIGNQIAMLKLNKPFEIGTRTMIFTACFHASDFMVHFHSTYTAASYGDTKISRYRSIERKIPNFAEVYWKSRYLMKTKVQARQDEWCEVKNDTNRCIDCSALSKSICLIVDKPHLCKSDIGAPLVSEEYGGRFLVGVAHNYSDCQNRKVILATQIWLHDAKKFIFRHTENEICLTFV